MKTTRRGFLGWLAALFAGLAVDPLIGGQSVWGTEPPAPEPPPKVVTAKVTYGGDYETEVIARMQEAIMRGIDRDIIDHLLMYGDAGIPPVSQLKGKLS